MPLMLIFLLMVTFLTFSLVNQLQVYQFCRYIFFILFIKCGFQEISFLRILDFLKSINYVGKLRVQDIFVLSKADQDHFILQKEVIHQSFMQLRILWPKYR